MPVFPLANNLQSRLTSLPLVLAGPILRRVEAGQVSVWIATKGQTALTLRVTKKDDATVRMQGSIAAGNGPSQMVLGPNLAVSCITATPVAGAPPLVPGDVNTYSLEFAPGQTLASPGILSTAGGAAALRAVAYVDQGLSLPSFCLPGNRLGALRVAHAGGAWAHESSA